MSCSWPTVNDVPAFAWQADVDRLAYSPKPGTLNVLVRLCHVVGTRAVCPRLHIGKDFAAHGQHAVRPKQVCKLEGESRGQDTPLLISRPLLWSVSWHGASRDFAVSPLSLRILFPPSSMYVVLQCDKSGLQAG